MPGLNVSNFASSSPICFPVSLTTLNCRFPQPTAFRPGRNDSKRGQHKSSPPLTDVLAFGQRNLARGDEHCAQENVMALPGRKCHPTQPGGDSCSVVPTSLRPHGLQHARLPCPSLTPGACSNSSPPSQLYHLTFSSSVIPFSSRFQSFPALGSFPMSWLFASGGQSTGAL